VTEFFRTPEKFAELEEKVVPDLLTRSSRLNVWSAGAPREPSRIRWR
jgi:chemotaxis protein methyltransferase CheR